MPVVDLPQQQIQLLLVAIVPVGHHHSHCNHKKEAAQGPFKK